MSDDKHIKVDLDFLDKNTKEKPRPTPTPTQKTSDPKDPNWVPYNGNQSSTPKKPMSRSVKGWLWFIGAIVLLVVISSFSGNDDTTPTPTPTTYSNSTTNSGNQAVSGANGQTYMCSDSDYDQAVAMKPSSTESSELDNESSSIDSRTAALQTEKDNMDSMNVTDNSDQSSIDEFNADVDDYNSKNAQLKIDIANYNQELASFNAKVDAYNNYLDAHCTAQ